MNKLKNLQDILRDMKSVVVAFSGGVDSTFLLKIAVDTLGKENVLAVTADSPLRFEDKVKKAQNTAREIGARHLLIKSSEIEDKNFAANNHLRCYHCKYNLYRHIKSLAGECGFDNIIDGTNYEELHEEDRPGLRALRELNITMPLAEVKFKKDEIRKISRKLALSTWDQRSDTCLATRISQQLEINRENIEIIRNIELFLKKYNFTQLRARLHDRNTIRLEVSPADMIKVIDNREEIYKKVKSYGITYVTLDIEGYRGTTGLKLA